MLSHDAVSELLHKAMPSMLYEQRKLLEQRDYETLLGLLNRGIREAKVFMWFMAGLIMANPFVQGVNIVRRSIRDGAVDGSLYGVLVFMAITVVITGVLVAFQMSRFALMERARFALQTVVRKDAAAAAIRERGGDDGREHFP